MSKTARLNVRTTEALKKKVGDVAKERGVTVAEMINDYLKRLPQPKV